MDAKHSSSPGQPDDGLRKLFAGLPAKLREDLLQVMAFAELKHGSRMIARTLMQTEFMRWLEAGGTVSPSAEPIITEELRHATLVERGYLGLLLSGGRQSFARCRCSLPPCACLAKDRANWTILSMPAYRMLKILSGKGEEGASFESLFAAAYYGDHFRHDDKHRLSELISSSLRTALEPWGLAVDNVRSYGYRLREAEIK